MSRAKFPGARQPLAFRQVSASEEVRELVESRLKAERDEITRLSRARQEGQLLAAQKMLAKGVDPQVLCEALGLHPDDLKFSENT